MTRYASRTDRLAGLGSERWAVHQRAIVRQSAGDEIVMLSISERDTPTPAAIVDAAIDSLRRGRIHYSVGKGEPVFLEAVARRYSTRLGRRIGAEQVIFMPGAHTALYAVCHAVLDEGDHLLAPSPTTRHMTASLPRPERWSCRSRCCPRSSISRWRL